MTVTTFVLNVPKDLLGKVRGKSGQPVRQVRKALRTVDMTVAKRKAFELEEIKRTEWQLLALGDEALTHQKFEAAKWTAERRGFVARGGIKRCRHDANAWFHG